MREPTDLPPLPARDAHASEWEAWETAMAEGLRSPLPSLRRRWFAVSDYATDMALRLVINPWRLRSYR